MSHETKQVALAGCGTTTETVPGPELTDSTATAQAEVGPSADDVSAAGEATIVEDTTTTSSVAEAPSSTTAASEDSSAAPGATSLDISSASSAGPLDQAAADGLLWMREEEKLDVYLALSQRSDLPIFANTAESEQTHTDAVGDLLESYDIPTRWPSPGVFEDPTIQALYDSPGGARLTVAH